MPMKVAQDLGYGQGHLQPSSTKIQGVAGNSLNVLGQFMTYVSVKGNFAVT